MKSDNAAYGTAIAIRQACCLNNIQNIQGQDHRAVNRVVRPLRGFNTPGTVQHAIAGTELMHMLCKTQLEGGTAQGRTPAEQFYALAA
jgi:putative transposase